MSRRENREEVFKIIFEAIIRSDGVSDVAASKSSENKFINSYCNNIQEKIKDLDEILSNSLKEWNVEELGNVEKSILTLAIYEIFHEKDVDYKVAINEAVELSKKYGENSSPKFINGILATVVKEIK